MSELPDGWVEIELGALANFTMGQAPPGAASNFEGVGTPFVKAGEFGEIRPVIREWTTQPLKFASVQDVLICVVGATSGKINLGADCAIGRSVAAIKPQAALEQLYLFNFLKTKVQQLRRGSMGTAQGVIAMPMLAEILVPLAPRTEQVRIVEKIQRIQSRTRRARGDLDRVPALIARYKQRLLALAFSGDLTTSWRADRSLPTPVQVELSSVVKGLSYGSSAKSAPSGEIPVLRMGNIQDGKLDWKNLVFTSDRTEIAKYELVAGDVLFNRTNSPELVGKTALYRGERPAVYAGYLIRIQCGDRLLPEFLAYCLNGPAARAYCWQVKTDGVSQSNINAKKIAAFQFPLPGLEEQAEIVRRIDSAFSWLDRVEADHSNAAKLLLKLDSAILAKAFRGALVPQDPDDEPANILLARIGAQPARVSKRGGSRLASVDRPSGNNAVTDATSVVLKDTLMSKSRHDPDVKGLPYLAKILRKQPSLGSVEGLFKAADLPVADFYKQLAWEIENHHISDQQEKLEAA